MKELKPAHIKARDRAYAKRSLAKSQLFLIFHFVFVLQMKYYYSVYK